ncbi:uncharacterized protein A1O9_11708 [Exophiala aquamarina CBS 119918]|uniref:RING-type E3 ubiquitin transferase n=1 Tax=Exophiala aquamarina CBS 119918 TaxID=1182545 RepID=A0A072NXC9_9EURO|nr:uncharacterized protein A1O9_11708 [Exophiala aquamarina CBS 119918]KEF52082.1 hypothetical protein A1O9_11708 [Exophiala aquamarina CBS 119918]
MSFDFHDVRPFPLDRIGDRQATDEDAQEHCRICRGEASPHQPLYYPCKCSGSIKFVHQECLKEWLSHSQKKYCELCKTSFRFTKLYDRSMPHTLPFPLFLHQITRHALSAFLRHTRYLLVGLVWLCCLPWSIRQIWRGLFWLADGNWLDEQDILLEQNATLISSVTLDPVQPTLEMTPSFERLNFVLPPMQLSLADITRAAFSQGLIGRMLQLIFTLLIPTSTSTNASPSSHAPTSHRSPSLLSDVQFLANCSAVPAINHLTLDVVEGQLICISLVTAFILVFLIREWVINQQPIHNMPDLDGHDNPVPPPAPVDLNAPPMQRLRRQNPRRDQEPHADRAPVDQAPRPIAIPRLRRALTDDNLLNDIHADPLERPGMSVRSESLIADPSARAETRSTNDFGDSPTLFQESDSPSFSRRALSNSIIVQREVEIVPGSDAGAPEHDSLAHDLGDEAQLADFVDPSLFLPDSSNSSHPDSASFEAHAMLQRSLDYVDPEQDQEENSIMFDADLDNSNGAVTNSASEDPDSGIAGSSSTTSTGAPDTPAPPEESRLQKISAWLWHVDDQQRAPRRPETRDMERIVENLLDEAPFVPNPHQEQPGILPPVLEAPVPPAREPADVHDPNAADDADDIDGILELLGMEGPLFGMVQNVVFSLFLITITLSASVWCPYVWGKIALLFISNPVGMLIKAPLFVLSRAADLVVDVIFFAAGIAGIMLNASLRIIQTSVTPLFPGASNLVDLGAVHDFTLEFSQKSSTRLQKTLVGAMLNLKPDLPTFSVLSHHALISLKASFSRTVLWTASCILRARAWAVTTPLSVGSVLSGFLGLSRSIPGALTATRIFFQSNFQDLYSFGTGFDLGSSARRAPIDSSLVAWGTEDRIITIIIGYAFFAAAGVIFLELAHLILGLRDDEKVEGYFADCLRQAGGVMKVIVIIGIEMLVFPLYCGLLLDVALLPLFANATLTSRITFLIRAPFTGIFIHWFIGTCYMFHFALFVGICRKILRKGVLYFIRDPDDPTFHPVRDVLERPIPTQLGKIAFSALVYGGLVMLCLGGVVWTLEWIGGVLPIQWATPEPKLAFPVDVIFYNLMLPLILRKVDPSKRFTALYEWWFRSCAKGLRLTAFLFGDDREEEKTGKGWPKPFSRAEVQPSDTNSPQNGTFVRAPASDSVRIPRGQNVFLEVNERNERVDGLPDPDIGIHGKIDKRFVTVYLPPNFRSRIAAFILLLWLFAASTGVATTIGPLLLGRTIMRWISKSELAPNDLHAFTLGIHIFTLAICCVTFSKPAWDYLRKKSLYLFGHSKDALIQMVSFSKYVSGLIYLGTFTAVVLPCVLSTIIELYLHVPLFTYLDSGNQLSKAGIGGSSNGQRATIFILQTWTIGLLYLRLCRRLFLNYVAPDSQASIALRAIFRDGVWRPDVQLASRAFVLPATFICFILLATPLAAAKLAISALRVEEAGAQTRIYRAAYPTLLGTCLVWYAIWILQRQIANWRAKIRDEVYLIGERLHNFHDGKPEMSVNKTGKEMYL